MEAIEQSRMNSTTLFSLLVVLGAVLGTTLSFIVPSSDRQQTIEWLDNPRNISNFRLETDAGEIDNDALVGCWTIVSFGFLNCPDICPTSLSQLSALSTRLEEVNFENDMAYVFVSVDPSRDSIGEIGNYVRHFSPSFLGATGTAEQLKGLARDLGVQFKVTPGSDEYAVAHSVTFSIIDPEGTFRGRFRPGFNVANFVHDFTSKLKPGYQL